MGCCTGPGKVYPDERVHVVDVGKQYTNFFNRHYVYAALSAAKGALKH